MSPQLLIHSPVRSRAEPGWSQDLGIPSKFPMWVEGTKLHVPSTQPRRVYIRQKAWVRIWCQESNPDTPMWQPDHQAKQPVPLNSEISSEGTQELHPFFTDRWLEGCFCEVCLVYYTGMNKKGSLVSPWTSRHQKSTLSPWSCSKRGHIHLNRNPMK